MESLLSAYTYRVMGCVCRYVCKCCGCVGENGKDFAEVGECVGGLKEELNQRFNLIKQEDEEAAGGWSLHCKT